MLLLFASALLLLTPANALPRLDTTSLRKRDDWSPYNTTFVCMFMTTEPNWMGEQQNLCQVGGQCASHLPDGLTANLTSAGPSEGQTCFLYAEEDCNGAVSLPIVHPGYADLNDIGFAQKARSWRCWKLCGYTTTGIPSPSSTGTSATIPTGSGVSVTVVSITATLTGGTAFSRNSSNAHRTITITPESIDTRGANVAAAATVSSITTTYSGSEIVQSEGVEITTTMSGSLPSSSPTTSEQIPSDSSPTAAPTTSSATTSSPEAEISTSTTPALSSSPPTEAPTPLPTTTSSSSPLQASTTLSTPPPITKLPSSSFPPTNTTNTLAASFAPSPTTLTHTYADGSTTVITTSVLAPVPTALGRIFVR